MKEAVFEHFKPVYSAVNEVINPSKEVVAFNKPEMELFLPPIAELADKKIRKDITNANENTPIFALNNMFQSILKK